ncbi:MAG: hypothetical protein KC589_00865 [Nanoarchaeota archaeon]|nr:hypothetical protein [Nanoarchaeota archaeon]
MNLAKHLDDYLASEELREVLSLGDTLKEQVISFYDFNHYKTITKYSSYDKFEYCFGKEEKVGRIPAKLINLLGPFGNEKEKSLDKNLLEYSKVRNDKARWDDGRKDALSMLVGLGLPMSSVLVFSQAFIDYSSGNTLYSIFEVGAGILMFYKGINILANPVIPDGTDFAYKEFKKMWKKAKIADDFIENNYKNYLIKKKIYE